MGLAALTKTSLYGAGILGGYHRLRNRRRLTVVMFHRVLDEKDARWGSADPTWTVSPRLLADCLAFFQVHYNVIGIEDLRRACRHQQSLPERPLLITFDDGWADNAEYALPCLRAAGLPAVVFVVAGAVGEPELWNERLGRAWRSGSLDGSRREALSGRLAPAAVGMPARQSGRGPLWDLVVRLSALEENQRRDLLADVLDEPDGKQPSMLTPEQLRELHAAGVAIGAHGLTHAPMTSAADPRREVTEPRRLLSEILNVPSEPVALSFPHGAYDQALLRSAFDAGYELVFHSQPALAECPNGFPPTAVFGRIPVRSSEVADSRGRLCRERLATWLFLR
jgi:peptidoglycan/xylan/chitin deacetylase (PgdA/CDA1 family)